MDNCARRFLESTQFVVKVGVAGGGGGWAGLACILRRTRIGSCGIGKEQLKSKHPVGTLEHMRLIKLAAFVQVVCCSFRCSLRRASTS